LVNAVHGGRDDRTEITMTTSYVPPNRHPHIDHHAATINRPQMTFVPQVGPAPAPRPASSPAWKAGWVVSGLAAAVSIGAVSVVGVLAYDAFLGSEPTPESASVSTPASATPGGAVATPAPNVPAPAVALAPRLPDSVPSVGAPRVIVIQAPAAVPAVKADPVATPPAPVVEPPAPVSQPKPPLGIGKCDLVDCDTTPPAPGIPKCGDLVACDPTPPTPPAPSIPKCGDLVACTGPGSHP
jgi:hypothetical protein